MLKFEWDSEKARKTLAKRGISFDLAKQVWEDPLHVIAPDGLVDGEERWRAIGTVGAMTVLVVVRA